MSLKSVQVSNDLYFLTLLLGNVMALATQTNFKSLSLRILQISTPIPITRHWWNCKERRGQERRENGESKVVNATVIAWYSSIMKKEEERKKRVEKQEFPLSLLLPNSRYCRLCWQLSILHFLFFLHLFFLSLFLMALTTFDFPLPLLSSPLSLQFHQCLLDWNWRWNFQDP